MAGFNVDGLFHVDDCTRTCAVPQVWAPESPRWLLLTQNPGKAETVLYRILGGNAAAVQADMADMQASIAGADKGPNTGETT